jgi:hypothetical protein
MKQIGISYIEPSVKTKAKEKTCKLALRRIGIMNKADATYKATCANMFESFRSLLRQAMRTSSPTIRA